MASGTLAGIPGGVAHKWYDLVATVDEAADTVSVDYTDGENGTINLGTFTTSFGAGSTHFVGFRNYRDSINDGTFADMHIEDLQIKVLDL